MRDYATQALPPGWAAANLSEICEINPSTPIHGIPPDCRVSFVPMASVAEESGSIDLGTERALANVAKGYVRFRDGDVLFAKITPCMENGKIAVADNLVNGVGFGSTEFHVLRPCDRVSPRYLFYFLLRKSFRNDAASRMKGTAGQKRVPADVLKAASIPVPPFAEQDRIVARIDELFSDIDAGMASLRRAQVLLKRYRQSVLSAAVTGELTREWRMAQGRDEKPSWENFTFESLCIELHNGLSRKPAAEPPGLPILRISAVRPMAVDPGDVRYYLDDGVALEHYRVRRGDLLFTRYNGSRHLTGVCGLYLADTEVLHPDKIIKCRVRDTIVSDPRFLAIWFNAGEGRAFIESKIRTTAGQHGISGGDLKRSPVRLPPPDEQQKIATVVDELLLKTERVELDIAHEQERQTRLRQSILRAAFSGKLAPQDPADEPASALLERIRAARAAEGSGMRVAGGRRKARERAAG